MKKTYWLFNFYTHYLQKNELVVGLSFSNFAGLLDYLGSFKLDESTNLVKLGSKDALNLALKRLGYSFKVQGQMLLLGGEFKSIGKVFGQKDLSSGITLCFYKGYLVKKRFLQENVLSKKANLSAMLKVMVLSKQLMGVFFIMRVLLNQIKLVYNYANN
jgi:hypothetical protein